MILTCPMPAIKPTGKTRQLHFDWSTEMLWPKNTALFVTLFDVAMATETNAKEQVAKLRDILEQDGLQNALLLTHDQCLRLQSSLNCTKDELASCWIRVVQGFAICPVSKFHVGKPLKLFTLLDYISFCKLPLLLFFFSFYLLSIQARCFLARVGVYRRIQC